MYNIYFITKKLLTATNSSGEGLRPSVQKTVVSDHLSSDMVILRYRNDYKKKVSNKCRFVG